MDGTVIEWDVSTWDELARAIDSFNEGADMYLRLRGPIKDQELFHLYQVLDFLASDAKVAPVPADVGIDLAIFHAADTGPDGDREPRRPRPDGHPDSLTRDLPDG